MPYQESGRPDGPYQAIYVNPGFSDRFTVGYSSYNRCPPVTMGVTDRDRPEPLQAVSILTGHEPVDLGSPPLALFPIAPIDLSCFLANLCLIAFIHWKAAARWAPLRV